MLPDMLTVRKSILYLLILLLLPTTQNTPKLYNIKYTTREYNVDFMSHDANANEATHKSETFNGGFLSNFFQLIFY